MSEPEKGTDGQVRDRSINACEALYMDLSPFRLRALQCVGVLIESLS